MIHIGAIATDRWRKRRKRGCKGFTRASKGSAVRLVRSQSERPRAARGRAAGLKGRCGGARPPPMSRYASGPIHERADRAFGRPTRMLDFHDAVTAQMRRHTATLRRHIAGSGGSRMSAVDNARPRSDRNGGDGPNDR